MAARYLYGKKEMEVTSAAGVTGILLNIDPPVFRVYDENWEFTDYLIQHGDLKVTIDPNDLASFYTDGKNNYLDETPEVLGLEKVENEN